mgnify:CR=1 FL=1
MKTLEFLPFIFLSVLMTPPVYAQLPALPGAQPAAAQIGVVAGVNGTVKLTAAGQAGRIVESGEAVRLGDEITTDEKGRLQIMLLDETVFTIGPGTTLVIDEFVYDPASESGSIQAQVMKGVFRFVSGKIAKKNPGNVKVLLPTGSVGVRGTIFYGKVEGNSSTVLLLGPGEKNNTGHRAGRIVVRNEANGKQNTVDVAKSGFGSRIDGPGAPPSAPFRFSQEQISEMTAPLLPSNNQAETNSQPDNGGATAFGQPGPAPDGSGRLRESGTDGPSASERSGQGAFEALNDASAFKVIENFGEHLGKETSEASREAADNTRRIQGGITSLEQLRSIQTGNVYFERFDIPLFLGGSQSGNYDARVNINFGTRQIGGGNSKIRIQSGVINSGTNTFLTLGAKSYGGNFQGPASFVYGYPQGTIAGCGACSATAEIELLNRDNIIAERARVSLIATQTSTVAGSGETGKGIGGSAPPF